VPQIHKRFPADTTDEEITFLNDGKIDAELYAYLQSLSYPDAETKQTRVDKSKLPGQDYIAEEILKCKSRNTVGNHLRYLKETGFIIDEGKYYVLPDKEKMFFKMPLELLNYFIDVVKQPVLKTYIYLGQRFSYKPHDYVFTVREIAEHIGMNYNK
jgi:biotin operon repressor